MQFFCFSLFLPIRPVIADFVPFIFHYLHRSFFAFFLYFPFLHLCVRRGLGFLPVFTSFHPSKYSSATSSVLCLFVFYCHFLLLYAFPVVSSCFSRDYQTCTSQCSANHAFFPPALHSRPFSSLVRLYVVSEVHAVSLTDPRNKQLEERCIKGKSNAELFQALTCRFSFEKEITVCGLKQKPVWFDCDPSISICQSG